MDFGFVISDILAGKSPLSDKTQGKCSFGKPKMKHENSSHVQQDEKSMLVKHG